LVAAGVGLPVVWLLLIPWEITAAQAVVARPEEIAKHLMARAEAEIAFKV
jgi:hypothetical protein